MVIAVAVVHKTQLLASVYRAFYLAKVVTFETRKMDPLLTSSMKRASLKRVSKRKKEEAISYISSYQTLTADKNSKSYTARTKLKKRGLIYETIAVKLLRVIIVVCAFLWGRIIRKEITTCHQIND